MSGFYRTIEYIGRKINNAIDTKQSIITAANSYENIMRNIKEKEEKSWQKLQDKKIENIHFNPNEIEPLVLKGEDEEER